MVQKPSKKMQQMKIGDAKRTADSSTPDLSLTVIGRQAPTMSDPGQHAHLSSLFSGYAGGVENAIEQRAAAPERRRRQRRHKSEAGVADDSEEEEEDAALVLAARTTVAGGRPRRHTNVQHDAERYLQVLEQYTGTARLPGRQDVQQLEVVIRRHEFHDSVQTSQHAFRLLLQYIRRFPATQMQHFGADSPCAGMACVEVRDNCWCLNERYHKSAVLSPEVVSADAFFFQLWRACDELAESIDEPDVVKSRYGDMLLLRAALAQLQAELAPRLAAVRATAGPEAAARAAAGESGPAADRRRKRLQEQRHRLLEESHLWRLLKEMPQRGTTSQGGSRQDLITMLMRIIAAGADGPAATSPHDGSLVTVQELAGMARSMLRLLLELYGTAEASGYYSHAAGRIRQLDRQNYRVKLDEWLLDGFIGSDSVLRRWEQKQALLQALRPRDKLRFLGLLMAKRRVQRQSDSGKYASMQAAREVSIGHGETPSFLDVDPSEVLTYIADDLSYAQAACKTADDLALVVAHLGRAAALFRPDPEHVLRAYNKASAALLARHTEKGSALSAQSGAQLHGTRMLLEAAIVNAAA